MPVQVIMPKFGMTQETGTVVRWLRKEGEAVEQGDPLLEVETDKVVMEVESPVTGILGEIRAEEGQVVPVTEVIALVLLPGEEGAKKAQPVSQLPEGELRRGTPVAQRVAAEAGVGIEQITPSGRGGWVTRHDVEEFLRDRQGSERPRATPAARRLAREQNLDLAAVAGSGRHGRIQAVDVEAAIALPGPYATLARVAEPVRADRTGGQAPVPGPAMMAKPAHILSPVEPPAEEVVPLQGMRRTIADRMTMSYQTAPHVTFTVEADMTAAEALRNELNTRLASDTAPRISVTAILVKVCGWALARHRFLNASLGADGIHLHRSANVGVAVALEDGLIVPVIREAERLGLGEIARQVQDLTERARKGRLSPDDVSGGTFTISNLGMFGIKHFTAIINPPQSGILAVGRVIKQATVVEGVGGDEVVIRPMMQMTLSADHRVVDGAIAARFLQDIVEALEHPSLLLW